MIDMEALLVGCGLVAAFGFIAGIMTYGFFCMKRQEKIMDDEVIEPYSAWKRRRK